MDRMESTKDETDRQMTDVSLRSSNEGGLKSEARVNFSLDSPVSRWRVVLNLLICICG